MKIKTNKWLRVLDVDGVVRNVVKKDSDGQLDLFVGAALLFFSKQTASYRLESLHSHKWPARKRTSKDFWSIRAHGEAAGLVEKCRHPYFGDNHVIAVALLEFAKLEVTRSDWELQYLASFSVAEKGKIVLTQEVAG